MTTPTPTSSPCGRRYVVSQSVTQLGAVASGGFGYVLAADAATARRARCTSSRPSCATAPEVAQAHRTRDVSYGWLIDAFHGITRAVKACAPLSRVGISPMKR